MVQQQVHWGHRLATWAATGFGIGRVPFAPGTFGTLLGIPVYLVLRDLPAIVYLVVLFVLFGLGVWLCHIAERELGGHDHPAIVWDEIVGFLIGAWLAPHGWLWIAAAFVLFRLFDVWKPAPIRRLQDLPGGLGVMADDALAGVYAFAALQAAVWLAGARAP